LTFSTVLCSSFLRTSSVLDADSASIVPQAIHRLLPAPTNLSSTERGTKKERRKERKEVNSRLVDLVSKMLSLLLPDVDPTGDASGDGNVHAAVPE